MVRRMSSREARANFAELLGSVHYTREPVIVEGEDHRHNRRLFGGHGSGSGRARLKRDARVSAGDGESGW